MFKAKAYGEQGFEKIVALKRLLPHVEEDPLGPLPLEWRREQLKRLREEAGTPAAEWQGVNLNALEPEQIKNVLADTVLAEFKKRLNRIGIEYQTPARP